MSRPRKPTELKLLEGNKGKRAQNSQEPQPDFLNDLEPPAWLPDDAKAIWRELAFRLRATKVLTILDVPALEKMCVAIATWRRATLAAHGVELIDKADEKEAKREPEKAARAIGFTAEQKSAADPEKGQAEASAKRAGGALNPWLIVQSMAFKQATALMREFGMTPAARSRVMVDPQLGLFGNAGEKKADYFT